MSHTFNVGDKAIVMAHSLNHYFNLISIVEVIEVDKKFNEIRCRGISRYGGTINQTLLLSDLQPMPIPYPELDGE